jgi:hypothetical protein
MKWTFKKLMVLISLATLLPSSVALADWVSASHLGFATVRNSTLGYEAVSGSLVFFDALRPVGAGFELGLRTIAQGGEGPKASYYRLGAGPLVSLKLGQNWRLQAVLASFNETDLSAIGERIYQSKGRSIVFGWERSTALAERMDLVWGGFAIFHEGDLEPTATMSLIAENGRKAASNNRGISQGIQGGLRFSL